MIIGEHGGEEWGDWEGSVWLAIWSMHAALDRMAILLTVTKLMKHT